MSDRSDKIKKFRKNLKKHLSNEYLILSEKKVGLESDVTQIRVEIERRDRTLFPSNEHGDARKYFSPLNLSEIKESQKSEKEKELNRKLSGINKEIDDLEKRMSEIMDFLRDVDEMLPRYDRDISDSSSDNYKGETSSQVSDSGLEVFSDDSDPDRNLNQKEGEGFSKSEAIGITTNMKSNLDHIVEYFNKQDSSFEIIYEYNVKADEFDQNTKEFLVEYIVDEIELIQAKNMTSVVLVEFSEEKDRDQNYLSVTISCDSDKTDRFDHIKTNFYYKI